MVSSSSWISMRRSRLHRFAFTSASVRRGCSRYNSFASRSISISDRNSQTRFFVKASTLKIYACQPSCRFKLHHHRMAGTREPLSAARGLCSPERTQRYISCPGPLESARDICRQIYFSKTLSTCPIFFSTLPVFFSALPSACKLGLFVTLPAVSLILPFTS